MLARSKWLLCVYLACVFMSDDAHSQAEREIPTLYFVADGGTSTYKSKLVASNDTATSIRYGMGLFAGQDKLLGFALRSDSQSTTFELNSSEVVASWQETVLKYRWNYFYAGAIISIVNMTATTEAGELFDLTGSGYGGTIGGFYPFAKVGTVTAAIDAVSISTIKESNQVDVAIGQRLDIDLGASFSLTRKKWLDLLIGYRMRTLSITTTEAFAEQITTTYLGFSSVFLF